MACTSTPAAPSCSASQSRAAALAVRFLAAHDQHAIARAHLACHLLPQCFGIELRGSRRRRIHERGGYTGLDQRIARSRFRAPRHGYGSASRLVAGRCAKKWRTALPLTNITAR